MSVNLRRFVNLNVSRTRRNSINPVRDTVAVLGATYSATADPAADWDGTSAWADKTDVIITSGYVETYSDYQHNRAWTRKRYVLQAEGIAEPLKIKLDEIQSIGSTYQLLNYSREDVGTSISKLYFYARYFFDNGGVKMHVYVGAPDTLGNKLICTSKPASGSDPAVYAVIPDEEIAVAFLGLPYDEMRDIIRTYNQEHNPDESSDYTNLTSSAAKVFITFLDGTVNMAADYNQMAQDAYENLGLKKGLVGVEMSILAYLSRINVYGENTVNDYAFTPEEIFESQNVFNDDETVADCMNKKINVDSKLPKVVRNVGGNLLTGFDLVNYYVTIILQQTCEAAVMEVLPNKLSGADGVATIYNALVKELNKYVRCGLLAAGNWEDVDWIETFNDDEYVVVNAGERLTLGYKVLVVPFNALTQAQVSEHECPPIYVAMTNKYGIRKVFINGEVR